MCEDELEKNEWLGAMQNAWGEWREKNMEESTLLSWEWEDFDLDIEEGGGSGYREEEGSTNGNGEVEMREMGTGLKGSGGALRGTGSVSPVVVRREEKDKEVGGVIAEYEDVVIEDEDGGVVEDIRTEDSLKDKIKRGFITKNSFTTL
eukprot:TRINITY_DN5588_c0_g1_i2.p1 TRINITY_DN5588_c0_g1~~TRINITY_DN5588_c0_g1_i2.p1  ORF type:complete len:148 (+),score=76.81 TRINITY_DN5588_c0_g1_i2:179-622(+)